MNLKDALDNEVTRPSGCGVCRTLRALSDEDRELLLDALDNLEVYGHTRIARALAKLGHKVGDMAVSRHRRNNHNESFGRA